MDERFSNILADKNVNIDELNYLMKRLDSFDSREMETRMDPHFSLLLVKGAG